MEAVDDVYGYFKDDEDTNEWSVEKETFLKTVLTEQQGYTGIQMTKWISGHLHVDIQLNEVNGSFILDTGAGATVLEENKKSKYRRAIKTCFF